MANDKITSDIINRRLGNQGPSRSSDYDNGYDDPRSSRQNDAETSEGGGMSFGFLASIMGVFAAFGLGTFFVMGSGFSLDSLSPAKQAYKNYVSVADNVCGKAWKDKGNNDSSISCYLTTNVTRLCKSEERTHLAAKFKQYSLDYQYFLAAQQVDGLKAKVKVQQNIVHLLNNPAELKKHMSGEYDNFFDDPLNRASFNNGRLWMEMNNQRDDRKKVVDLVRGVGEMGYMTKGDFGWFPDSRVNEAFEDIVAKPSPCKS
jgi:hypothetical protein